tara:strand:- start:362 stop:514 length:153 start_codon:yes stop_codon:yes gene_type:complete
MIRLLKRLLGIKPKPINYVWFHIMSNQYRGVIGTGRTRKDLIKGEDTWNR